jgi:hypothetical protein
MIKLNGGRSAILAAAPAEPLTPAQLPPPGLAKIYSTLGTGDHVYSTVSAIGILGTKAGQPWPEMVGNGFRPKSDYLVTEVAVGETHYQNTNVLVVSLNQDNHGVPGKALHTWHFSNLPPVWTCCTLQTGKYAKGIPVKKGKLYWVVLRPEGKFQDNHLAQDWILLEVESHPQVMEVAAELQLVFAGTAGFHTDTVEDHQERMGHALTGSFTLDVYGHVLDWQGNVDVANKAGAVIERAVDAEKLKNFVNVTAVESLAVSATD